MIPVGPCALGLSLVMFVPAVLGQANPAAAPPPTPECVFSEDHVARLRSVSAARTSPNGEWIAYLLRVPRRPFEDENGPPWSELHVVDQAGNSRAYVTGRVDVSAISWLPDGSRISFLAKRGKDEHVSLYAIPIDGGEAERVLSLEADISNYSWSPDGTEVAALAAEKEDAERNKRKDKGFSQEVYEEDWRPVRVWIVKPADGTAKPRPLELPGSASELHWSPVGRKLALALAPTPLIDDEYMKRKLCVVDADSGKVEAKFDNPGKLGMVSWSPDGKHLAYLSANDVNDPSAGRLFVVPATGGVPFNVLPDFGADVSHLAWQDNEMILYLTDEGVGTTFAKVNRSRAGRKNILDTGKAMMTALSLSRDGLSAALLCDKPDHPTEVYALKHGEKRLRRLTDNNPWLKDMCFARQDVVRFKARDGLQLEGMLLCPPGESESKGKFPLILYVHGGPEAHERNGWLTSPSMPGQVAAARGFYVYYVNYRGSTGRGIDFSKKGQGDYAGKEFDDLIDAVDHLIQSRKVDPARVGVTGGSYGGFAAAWCATYYSKKFAAAVMNVGISNHLSMAGTTDIPEEWFLVHARKRLWEDWKFFLERSPIYHVQRSNTPILILHGKDDPRVPRTQSLELYRSLKTLAQAPVRLVYYPGEGHGNRKAAARYDYHLRMMQWFEHYLKGSGGEPPPFELEYPLEKAGLEVESNE